MEWLEIEESGTKYIVRLVERKKEIIKETYRYQSITAKKSATLTSIKADAGEKVKAVNEYVKAGDTIISGMLTKTNGEIIYMKARGRILGEVWYKVDIEYPLYYQEEMVTGKSKNVLSLYFLNKEIPLFPYKKYKQFKKQSKVLIENNFVPIKITKEKLYEVKIKDDIYTPETAILKAMDEAKKKLQEKNSNIESIKEVIVLDRKNLNSKIKVNLFISVIEDITSVTEIVPENIDN